MFGSDQALEIKQKPDVSKKRLSFNNQSLSGSNLVSEDDKWKAHPYVIGIDLYVEIITISWGEEYGSFF